MRNGFLFAIGTSLLSTVLAQAQTLPLDIPSTNAGKDITAPAAVGIAEKDSATPPVAGIPSTADKDSAAPPAAGSPSTADKDSAAPPAAGSPSPADKDSAAPPAAGSPSPEKLLDAPTPRSLEANGGSYPAQSAAAPCCDPPVAFVEADPAGPRAWLAADYLLWWIKNGPLNTSLVSTGSFNDPVAGAIGQPNTQVLFGDRAFDFGAFSGMRLSGGVGLTEGLGIEGSYFLLEQKSVQFNPSSDAAGNPLLGRPVFDTFNGLENNFLTSIPDPVATTAGNLAVAAHTRLQGYEVNLAVNAMQNSSLRLVGLAGFRALDLNEDLFIQETVLPPGTANFTFLGNFLDPTSTIYDYDRFHTSNHFYGGQVGARLEWLRGNLSVGVVGKLALGCTQQTVVIDGATTITAPGAAPVTVPGGLLAETSNIGRYHRSQFSIVPEAQLNIGWQVRPWMRATVGYTFIYWNDVVRPGNQIDRNINTSLPPLSQFFGQGNNQGPPNFTFHNSDIWAQGINFGVRFTF